MKASRDQFPTLPEDLPENAHLNFDKRRDAYQVYTEKMVNGKVTRVTIGTLRTNGSFTYNKTYALEQELKKEKKKAASALRRLNAKADAEPKKKAAKKAAEEVSTKVENATAASKVDQRASNSSVSLNSLVLLTILGFLGKANTLEELSALNATRNSEFVALFGNDAPPVNVSRETLRRVLFLAEPQRINAFVRMMTEPLLLQVKNDKIRIIAADGQANGATGRRKKGSTKLSGVYYIMNLWDAEAKVCVGQSLIERKKNEIQALPDLLKGLDICGAVITADAMNTQKKTVEAIMMQKANYCLAVKENQPRLYDTIRFLFADQKYKLESEQAESSGEYDHGRIETRSARVLPADLLSEDILGEWQGLRKGTIVETFTHVTRKTTGEESTEHRYFICSLACRTGIAKKMLRIVRTHWSVENQLHWVLDVNFDQDRMQASDVNFIANSSALKKWAISLLYREQSHIAETEGKNLSLASLRARCTNLEYAVQVLARGLNAPMPD